jgi:DNA-binding LacI/PurR family transcriptional regulator
MAKKKEEEKVVQMKDDKPVKLTYEQLEEVARNLNYQVNVLGQKLNEAKRIIENINEIGLLLSVIDKAEYFESAFVDKCASKVQSNVELMWKQAETETETKE